VRFFALDTSNCGRSERTENSAARGFILRRTPKAASVFGSSAPASPPLRGSRSTSLLAKLASDHRKPNGQFVITPKMGGIFIEELPISKFHGIGPVTAERMKAFGFTLVAVDPSPSYSSTSAKPACGTSPSRGEDRRPVRPDRPRKSSGSETTFAEDLTKPSEIEAGVTAMADDVWVAGPCRRLSLRASNCTRSVFRWSGRSTPCRWAYAFLA
jgi:nucleotidyltransferase/DNA polymerase involved in DNA repair